MKTPTSFRMQIPFFYNKSESEFRQDIYERYDDMVVRQTAIHLLDDLWGDYPFQPAFDFVTRHLQNEGELNFLEIGCGVGRWIGTLAKQNPKGKFWGIDYSYQMLKRAHEFWITEKTIHLDLSKKGFSKYKLNGHALRNLNFGLAKAEKLPFANNSQDAVVSSFLIDRLEDPIKGLEEMYRVLKPDGKLILVSPLNFLKKSHWEKFYPVTQLLEVLKKIGFEILEWENELIVEEPWDSRGNMIVWKAIGIVGMKKEMNIES